MLRYSHLSDDERELIGLAKALGHSIGAIAQAIGRPKSTISRELSRNKGPSGRYSPRALARLTRTLMETCLGRDAGQRVLSGRIVRGIAERIDAVVWFSDLRGFTRIIDTTPEQAIPLLNDYSDVIVSAI